MPKIIENPQSKLMEQAGKQLQEQGYSAVTIRSVAKACGMGVGTVYNYFSSKDDLLAAYLLQDWKVCVAAIEAAGAYAESARPVLRCISDQLRSFALRHKAVFEAEAAAASFAGSSGKYHAMLRDQLAKPLRRFCQSDFAAQFIAEAVLTWTMAGTDFEELYGMLKPLV